MKKSLMLIFVLFYSCKMSDNKNLRQVEIKESIQGNWYYLLEESVSSTKDNYLKTYNEIYINNKKTFHYTELIGNLKPEEYIISKDSFFSRNYDGQMVFKGLIKSINDSDFELIFKSQVITYHKVKIGITLKDVISKTNSLDAYLKDYNKRLIKVKSKMKL